ncbi:MAG: ABC transporter permease [Muribaculaceae bacterium]|nr:ABC transporter permease [Muribaculaceae bacterium]
MSPFFEIFRRSTLQLVRRPIYWVSIFLLPLFCFLLLSSMMENGLPDKTPAGVIDRDGSALSRQITQSLDGMQLVDVAEMPNSFTEARHLMQEGKIFGFFLIPENFEADLLAGRGPQISFYTNMTYYVPASLLFKTFKSTALYTKAGVASNTIASVGFTQDPAPLLQPVNIVTRPISNPGLNYAIYLCVSFIPCVLQLMIILVTCFSLGQEIKYGDSSRLMQMARGSIVRAVAAKLLPQTLIWVVMAIFMESWLFGWQGYPMHGSWLWLTLSEVLFVLASQGFALFIFGLLPNLRLSLSVCALTGILSFSIAAFSFPMQSMYGAIAIFSYIVPIRYNYLIYIDQALNGIDIYYSRWWYVAYFVFMLLPLTILPRLKKFMVKPVYVP